MSISQIPSGNCNQYAPSYNSSFHSFSQDSHNTQNLDSPSSSSNNPQVHQLAYNRFSLRDKDDEVSNEQHFSQNVETEEDELQVIQLNRFQLTKKRGNEIIWTWKDKAKKKMKKVSFGHKKRRLFYSRLILTFSKIQLSGGTNRWRVFGIVLLIVFTSKWKGVYSVQNIIYTQSLVSWMPKLYFFLWILNSKLTCRRSGWSDKDMFEFSLNEYGDTRKKSFKFTHLLYIVKNKSQMNKCQTKGMFFEGF